MRPYVHFLINWLICLELELKLRCGLCTNIAPVRPYVPLPKYQVMRVGKLLDHGRDFCRSLAPLLPYAHIIPPVTRHLRLQIRGGANTEAWSLRPPNPAPALTPGLAQISGDPAWLTQNTLAPPQPPNIILYLATDALLPSLSSVHLSSSMICAKPSKPFSFDFTHEYVFVS